MRIILAALITVISSVTRVAGSVPGLPACAGDCFGDDYGGCNKLDVQCICSNTALISNLSCCVSQKCDKADQEATIQFADSLCQGHGVSSLPQTATCTGSQTATLSSTGTATTANSASATSPQSALAALSTSASSAAAAQTPSSGASKAEGAGLGLAVAGLLAIL